MTIDKNSIDHQELVRRVAAQTEPGQQRRRSFLPP